ncbi:hypothetical protein BGX34_009862 [Mortierella sp. NVP85]|nr:hypothetical protein BGX34_009862 [Mortierella sp. NVP85]
MDDEYPATMKFHARCVSIIGNLWRSKGAVGTATIGSSEAVQLVKKHWQAKRKSEDKDTSKPNIVMGQMLKSRWKILPVTFDVECRMIPVSAQSHHCLDPMKAAEACDENTIGSM